MEVIGTSLVKFLGYKRKSKMPIIESPIKKKEWFSISQDATQHTFSSVESEMEIDFSEGDSLFIELGNGDYILNYSQIQKNNSFKIPNYIKGQEDADIFKGWKYIDFINYFRDQCNTKYYDEPK